MSAGALLRHPLRFMFCIGIVTPGNSPYLSAHLLQARCKCSAGTASHVPLPTGSRALTHGSHHVYTGAANAVVASEF